MKEHYKTLKVDEKATQSEIKHSYRTLSKQFHSDKNGGSDEAQIKINIAYSILGDPEKRSFYDTTGKAPTESLEKMADIREQGTK